VLPVAFATGWLGTAGAGVPAGANPSVDPCIAAGGTPGTTAVPLQLTCTFATPNDGSTPSYAFVVPSGVTSATLDAFGGQGGSTASAAGGRAGEARGAFTGLGGTALTIVVAAGGAAAGSGGFPDGGNGGSRPGEAGGGGGGGGGGGSSVSSAGLPLVVAGGGGGAGDTVQVSGFPTGGKGADAAQSGGPAQAGTTSGACCNTVLGGGGGYNAGGAGGAGGRTTVGSCSTSTAGLAGQAGSAAGGSTGGSAASLAGSGGGGGGGDLGGGGGGSGADCDAFHSGGGGGGGGSSFVDPAAGSPAMPVGHLGDGVVVVTYTLPPPKNLVLDGGFEKPTVGGPLITLVSGATLGQWDVTAGSIDLIGSYWVSAAGAQSVDVAGLAPGTLSEGLSLPYADSYRISFRLAGNPGCGPIVKKLGVYWNGVLAATKRFDTTGHSLADLGWVGRSVVVTGLPGPAAIGFAALNAGSCGPALDAVSVKYR
jgi:Protein of unknown function (DUF642)